MSKSIKQWVGAFGANVHKLRKENADLRAELARRDAAIEKLEPLAKSAELELAAEYQKGYAVGKAVVSEGRAVGWCMHRGGTWELFNTRDEALKEIDQIKAYEESRSDGGDYEAQQPEQAFIRPAAPAPEAPTAAQAPEVVEITAEQARAELMAMPLDAVVKLVQGAPVAEAPVAEAPTEPSLDKSDFLRAARLSGKAVRGSGDTMGHDDTFTFSATSLFEFVRDLNIAAPATEQAKKGGLLLAEKQQNPTDETIQNNDLRLAEGRPLAPVNTMLSDQDILKLVCDHTGKRISLNVEECGQHIDFARALLAAQASPAKPDLSGLTKYSAVFPIDAYGDHDGLEVDEDGSYYRVSDVEAFLAAIIKEQK